MGKKWGILIVVQISFAQETQTVNGTVTDGDGMPLPGVNIVVKGTSRGTQSDFDGNYSILAKSNDILVFTYVGFVSQEYRVGNATTINAVMETDAAELEEVVVMGYVTKGRNEVTGSAVQVRGEELAEVPMVSADQALQGKVAGLTISASSGTPGSTQDIRIRGVGSITAGNEPLYVIDGVPVVNNNFSGDDDSSSLSPLSSINAQDIESMTVLKDASATAAYGARGSNGVIVITTKSGKSGETVFSVNSTVGFQNKAVDGRQVLTGAQAFELFLDGVYNTYGETYEFTREGAQQFAFDNGLDDGAYQAWIDAGRPEAHWDKVIKNEDALVQSYDISVQGGGEKSTFYASLGYNETEGIAIGTNFKRISGKINYSREFSESVNWNVSLTASNSLQDGISEQSAYFSNPITSPYFTAPIVQPYNQDGSYNLNIPGGYNPLYLVENDILQNDLTRALVNSSLDWEIIDNLTFETTIGLDYNINAYRNYNNRVHGNGEGETNGYAQQSTETNFNYVTQNSLGYSAMFDRHSLDAKVLIEFQENKNNYLYGYGQNFPADDLTYLANAPGSQSAYSSFADWKNISYLGLLNYNFDRRYIADFTYRREGSSRFAAGNRFGDFWSVGGAWNLHAEDFLINSDVVNQLRIRGSYGQSGNSAIELNTYQALLSYDADYAGQGAVYPSQFGNANLTWEKNKTLDVGIDYGLWNNRLTGSLAYYRKETFDLLQEVPLSRTTGHSQQNQNIGTMVNKGFEAELNFNVFNTDDFSWTIGGNVATVDNEVTELALDPEGNVITIDDGLKRTAVGHPVFEWYMRKYAGVDPQTGSPQWYVNGEGGETTSTYSEAEEAFQGTSALPTFSGGLNTHVNFKGFFVDASVYFAGGHSVYEDWAFYTQHAGLYTTLYYAGTENLMNRWQEPGDITDVPKMTYSTTGERASSSSTRFLYDGDYIRLKNIAVGYNLPVEILTGTGFDAVRVAVRGTNLLTWVKDDGLKYDPEVRANGYTTLTTPPVKTVSLNLNLKF